MSRASYARVQATVGVGTVLIWDFCVARTKGGGSGQHSTSASHGVALSCPPPLHHYPPPPLRRSPAPPQVHPWAPAPAVNRQPRANKCSRGLRPPGTQNAAHGVSLGEWGTSGNGRPRTASAEYEQIAVLVQPWHIKDTLTITPLDDCFSDDGIATSPQYTSPTATSSSSIRQFSSSPQLRCADACNSADGRSGYSSHSRRSPNADLETCEVCPSSLHAEGPHPFCVLCLGWAGPGPAVVMC